MSDRPNGSRRSIVTRYVRTVRHLRPWQVLGRLVSPFRRRLATWRLTEPPPDLSPGWDPSTSFPDHAPWNTRAEIRSGRFRFLNEEARLGRPVDWNPSDRSLLWRFNLHYFHYLHLLDAREQAELCRDWIDANPPGETVGWHPYPTALRLVNWCRAGLDEPDVAESLFTQAAYLFRTLETEVGGNHLLENARALVLAGRYLGGRGEAGRWIQRGLDLYREELDEQILSDGTHYERSPMYHALVLEGILDVLNVLRSDRPERARLERTAGAMADALAGMVHPDGGIALFNDATLEIAPPAGRLLDYARSVLGRDASRRTELPEAGYYVEEAEDLWVMIDGGPPGPEHLMAHAHADVFSYELSLFGKRLVVDTGVHDYGSGPMRDHVRGTAAHNTVQVDGVDQIECWHRFRVGRRSIPQDVEWAEADGGRIFRGTYRGYRTQIGDGITHSRSVEIDPDERELRVRDSVTGRGEHRVESRIHLHPDATVHRRDQQFSVDRDGALCTIAVEDGPAVLEEGWYCPRFGHRRASPVVRIGGRTSLPTELSYRITY